MTTFDEAFPAAAGLLDERGLLLNAQLLKVVEGDEALFREVREALIFDGLAEDRFGVGLARIGPPGARAATRRTRSSADSSDVTFAAAPGSSSTGEGSTADDRRNEEPNENDWWLMTGGVTRGPWKFATLRVMRRRGEIAEMDLVRQGMRGLWCSPSEVEGLQDVSDVVLPDRSVDASLVPVATPASVVSPGLTIAQRFARNAAAESESVTGRAIAKVEPSVDSDDDDVEFFLWESGHAVGPVSRSTLSERLSDGRLNADDFVQVGQDGEWQPVSMALNVQRASLRIPVRSTDSAETQPDVLRESPSQAGVARRSDGGGSAAKIPVSTTARTAKLPPARVASRTAIGRVWQQMSDIVGGPGRLRAIVFAVAAVMALIVWWRQPPSAHTIHREFAACHQKMKGLRERRAGPSDWSAALTRERPRIRVLMDGLKKRASAARPAEQELMWAGQYGLLELLKNPKDATEFERLFADHMSRAQRLIDPKGTLATEDVSNKQSAPVESPGAGTTGSPIGSTEKNP